jgi:hypothetical protein
MSDIIMCEQNEEIKQLKAQLLIADKLIERYTENVDYYWTELAGSWLSIREDVVQYQNMHGDSMLRSRANLTGKEL